MLQGPDILTDVEQPGLDAPVKTWLASQVDDDGTIVLAASGFCDFGNVRSGRSTLLTAILDTVAQRGVRRLVLDLTGVTFMDSAALSLLVQVHRQLERSGVRLELVAVGTVRRRLAMTGIDQAIPDSTTTPVAAVS